MLPKIKKWNQVSETATRKVCSRTENYQIFNIISTVIGMVIAYNSRNKTVFVLNVLIQNLHPFQTHNTTRNNFIS